MKGSKQINVMTWMVLRSITLNKISQTQKATYFDPIKHEILEMTK
jgi:hypothetical protein